MDHKPIEPTLLSLFRLSNVFWLAIYIPGLIMLAVTPSKLIAPLEFFGALAKAGVLLYLYSGWLQDRLKRWYLPVALCLAVLGPVLAQWIEMVWRIHRNVPPEAVRVGEGYLAGVLFVPLIVVSVQYNFRGMLMFTAGASGLHIALSLVLIPFGGAPLRSIVQGVLGLLVFFPVIGLIVIRLVDAQKARSRMLTEKNNQLVRYATTVERLAISHERNRLARELHDTLAHTLSAVAVQLEASDAQLANDPAGTQQTLRETRQLVRNGLQEARRAVQALRASPLEDLGLVLATQHLVASMAERSGLAIALDVPDELNDLSPVVEQCIYRITEEALTNTVRHANAQNATVSLVRDRSVIRLTVADDGCGFNPTTVSPDGHYGVVGMRERALLCDGQLDIHSTPHAGTTVRLTVEDDG